MTLPVIGRAVSDASVAVTRERIHSLDALRALAVAGVLAVHFSWSAKAVADWGAVGVRLFFVLSGFLITSLLLDARRRIDARTSSVRSEVRHFFIRRLLRLAPAYYLALFGAVALNVAYARDSVLWHAVFLSNYYILHLGKWPDLLSHFWTLALEFQFYLVWPFVVLGLGRRSRAIAVGVTLLVGPLARWTAPAWGVPGVFSGLPFPGCIDLFGWGAAVAIWRDFGDRAAAPFELASRRFLPLGLLGTGLLAWSADSLMPPAHFSAIAVAVMAATFAALVAQATSNEPPRWARCLGRCRPLVYLGTMSYGVYLYHNFMHWLAPRVNLRLFGQPYLASETAHVAVLLTLTLIVSALSWHCVEQPVRRRCAVLARRGEA